MVLTLASKDAVVAATVLARARAVRRVEFKRLCFMAGVGEVYMMEWMLMLMDRVPSMFAETEPFACVCICVYVCCAR